MSEQLSDEFIDKLLEPILRASGSRLGNYTMRKTLDDMRSALRSAIAAALADTVEDAKIQLSDYPANHGVAGHYDPRFGFIKAAEPKVVYAGGLEDISDYIGLIKLIDALPDPDVHDKVIIFTEGSDFAGEQFFHVSSELLIECFLADDNEINEVCEAATHWMPEPGRDIPGHTAAVVGSMVDRETIRNLSEQCVYYENEIAMQRDVIRDLERQLFEAREEVKQAGAAEAARLQEEG